VNIFLLKDDLRVSRKHGVDRRARTEYSTRRNVCSTVPRQSCVSYYITYTLCNGSHIIIVPLERESLFGTINERLVNS